MTDKTSTFTIHHDRCDPSKWTPADVLLLADFIRTGDMMYAAALARRGMQLILSELHVPKGGELEEVGWSAPDASHDKTWSDLDDLVADLDDGRGPVEICRIYRGQPEFAVRIAIGDEDEGYVEGHEIELKPTLEEARAFIAALEDAGSK